MTTTSIAATLRPASEHRRYLRALLYGPSGIGKTTSLLTLPHDSVALFWSDRSIMPIRHSGIHATPINGFGDCERLVAEFQRPGVKTPKGDVIKTIVIDSISEISEQLKKQIVEVDRKALIESRRVIKGGGRGVPASIAGDDKRPAHSGLTVYEELFMQEEWALHGTRMKTLISALCHMPYNVIMTAHDHETEERDPRGMVTRVTHSPALGSRSTNQRALGQFDCIMAMVLEPPSKGEGSRSWMTQPTLDYVAKDSTQALMPYEVPDWTALFNKVFQSSPAAPVTPKVS